MRDAHLLLVEDNPADVRLMQEVLKDTGLQFELSVARDGEQATDMLFQRGEHAEYQLPDIVLLDLNLPKKDGRQVLAEVKDHPQLRRIPVIVLSTSKAEADVLTCYELHANCYLSKPVDLDDFSTLVEVLRQFWFNLALLPARVS